MKRFNGDWIFLVCGRLLRGSIQCMKRLAVILWICALPGCGTSGSLIGGDFIDSWADSRPDPGVDAGSDTGVDAPAQDPFFFVLVNPTSEPMYVDWSMGGHFAVHGRRALGSGLERFAWFHPFCMLDCASIPDGECACIDCAPHEPVVVEIPPSSDVRLEWAGPSVFHTSVDACGCGCSMDELLAEPSYGPHFVTAGVESYSDYDCWGSCGMDSDGIIHGAYPQGERHCALADADVPVRGDMVLVLGGAECWREW